MLILDWDGTDYVSAPLSCISVARIKVELERAHLKTSTKVRNAGLGVLGHALGRRLACKQEAGCPCVVRGSEKYKNADPDYEYDVDAAILVPDAELQHWRYEKMSNGQVSDDSYQVCRIDGNI